ncbi:MAG: MmcQ/YjbR family DNA-binding protein [Acidimicrobiales bacterium]
MAKGSARLRAAAEAMRQFAFSLPGAWEDFPWDESVAKVGKKVFVFNIAPADQVTDRLLFSVKLPESGEAALSLPYTSPTGYGLGRGGWVTVDLDAGPDADAPPVDVFLDWIEESYRAVALKKHVAELDANPPATARR